MDIKLPARLRLTIDFYSQWVNPFSKKLNWLDFTFLELYCEHDRVTEVFEVTVGLLGFTLTFGFWRATQTIKPTGSISTMPTFSLGAEPVYRHVYVRGEAWKTKEQLRAECLSAKESK